jgi:D-aminopeptidase
VIALAFSAATRIPLDLQSSTIKPRGLAGGFNAAFNPIFEAAVELVHEAVLNSMFAADTMTGYGGTTVPGLPIDAVTRLLRSRGVL